MHRLPSMNGRISIGDGGSNSAGANSGSELHRNQLLLRLVSGPLNHNRVLAVSVLWGRVACQRVVDDVLNIEVNSGMQGLVDTTRPAQVPDALIIASIHSAN